MGKSPLDWLEPQARLLVLSTKPSSVTLASPCTLWASGYWQPRGGVACMLPGKKSSSENMRLGRPWGDLLSSPKDHWGLPRDRPTGLGTRKAMSYGKPIIEVMVHISTHIVGVPWDLMTWLPTASGLMEAEPQELYPPPTCSLVQHS